MGSSRLIIGLDYGTTYTGVSFCEISDPASEQSHVEIVQDWPSCHGKFGTREKVPSEIAYLQEGVRWGSDIPPHEKRHMWTKLELDNREDGEVAKINNELSLLESRKPPMKIIADFLEQVKTHLIKNLDDSSLAFKELKMPIVLTTEPEAAALYTIKTLRGTAQDAQFAVGDGFTVCDMGGGTVDLITYRITAIQPTVIEEASVGNGAQCGGSFVDRAFLHWLERRLGTQDFVKIAGSRSEEILRTSLNEKTAQLVQDFTMGIKCGFSGTQENYLRLPYPLSTIDGDEKKGIVFGNLKIAADDVKAMFDSCLCRTYELLQEQTQRARIGNLKIKYVFMVGGFSESPYMFSKIKDFLEKQEIQAIRPPYAWSAVVRGAVTKGLEKGVGAVLKRKSRRHYGTSCARLFQKRAHKRVDMFTDWHSGKKMANNQMKWLIEKGQTLLASEATHAATGFMLRWWVGEEKQIVWKLLSCDADIAPSRSVDKSVYRVAVLTVDSNDIPLVYLKRNTSPCGRQYYSINVTVHISLQSSLDFYVTIKGKKFGSLTVSYD